MKDPNEINLVDAEVVKSYKQLAKEEIKLMKRKMKIADETFKNISEIMNWKVSKS